MEIQNSDILSQIVKLIEEKHPDKVEDILLECKNVNLSCLNDLQIDNEKKEKLKKYVEANLIGVLIVKKLYENNITYAANDTELIKIYLDIVLNRQKEQNNNIDNQDNHKIEFNIIRIAFVRTLNKYGKEQANGAFKDLYLNNSAKYFTNDYGARDDLNNLINSQYNLKKIILNNIDIEGLNVNNIDDILSSFINSLGEPTNNKKL